MPDNIALMLTLIFLVSCANFRDVHHKKTGFARNNSSLKNRLITASSGRIGCPPEKITVRGYYEFNIFHSTWEAHCRGQAFYCSQSHTSLSCMPDLSRKQTPQPVRKNRGQEQPTSKDDTPIPPPETSSGDMPES